MARIKINDLPKDMKISKEEMKKVVGGALITTTTDAKIGEFKEPSMEVKSAPDHKCTGPDCPICQAIFSDIRNSDGITGNNAW